ncbi:glycosyltransferase family 87 protein [Tundrisphaera lichenicola]|uniref:glycosyltransferase family 87 protein n=1 Tax=Tundrisphaera lichenicola TaxID=2029860 RepID=UPI003EC0A536
MAWFRSRTRFERIVLIACLVAIPAELAVKSFRHSTTYGDFNVHREFGRRFLAREPLYINYEKPDRVFCYNYMPISGLYYAPLALVPPGVASLFRTSAALLCLVLTFRWLESMIRPRARPGSWRGVGFGAAAVLLTLQYVVRDLDDGGPHLILLALIVGSFQLIRRGREAFGAAGIGLAIALKMTPGLFLPYFAWKRKWRLAGLSMAWTAAWIVLPAIWMGPSGWWDHQQQWNRVALNVFSDRTDSVRRDNEARVQNQALKPAILRYLVAYPPGHPLKVDHPADRAFLNLDPSTANRLASLASLGLLAGVAWWSRRPGRGTDDPMLASEMAAVLILIPLLSPVTWLQHLVFLLPAAYLLVVEHRAIHRLGSMALATVGLFAVLANVLSRDLVGRGNSLLLLSLHIHTLAMLLLLGLLMARRPTVVPALTGSTDLRVEGPGPPPLAHLPGDARRQPAPVPRIPA